MWTSHFAVCCWLLTLSHAFPIESHTSPAWQEFDACISDMSDALTRFVQLNVKMLQAVQSDDMSKAQDILYEEKQPMLIKIQEMNTTLYHLYSRLSKKEQAQAQEELLELNERRFQMDSMLREIDESMLQMSDDSSIADNSFMPGDLPFESNPSDTPLLVEFMTTCNWLEYQPHINIDELQDRISQLYSLVCESLENCDAQDKTAKQRLEWTMYDKRAYLLLADKLKYDIDQAFDDNEKQCHEIMNLTSVVRDSFRQILCDLGGAIQARNSFQKQNKTITLLYNQRIHDLKTLSTRESMHTMRPIKTAWLLSDTDDASLDDDQLVFFDEEYWDKSESDSSVSTAVDDENIGFIDKPPIQPKIKSRDDLTEEQRDRMTARLLDTKCALFASLKHLDTCIHESRLNGLQEMDPILSKTQCLLSCSIKEIKECLDQIGYNPAIKN